jgi:hypothetical protein
VEMLTPAVRARSAMVGRLMLCLLKESLSQPSPIFDGLRDNSLIS